MTDKPMTAAGQALFQHLTQLAGKPADRLLREQVLAIEAEAWKQGLEATIPPTYIDIASDAFTERLAAALHQPDEEEIADADGFCEHEFPIGNCPVWDAEWPARIAAAMRGEQG